MVKNLLLASVAAVSLATAAHAATIDVTLGTKANSAYTYSKGGTLDPNIDLTDNTIMTMKTNSGVLAAGTTLTDVFKSPTGKLYDNTYLFVMDGSKTTFNLASAKSDVFSFTWGSIDTYNTLTLTDARGVNYTITGTEILDQLSHPTAGTTQADVILTDPFSDFVKAVLTSTENSFEAANFGTGTSAVPLPASAVLFAMALAGLALLSRRHQRA